MEGRRREGIGRKENKEGSKKQLCDDERGS